MLRCRRVPGPVATRVPRPNHGAFALRHVPEQEGDDVMADEEYYGLSLTARVPLRPGSCDGLVFREVWSEDVYRMADFPACPHGLAALDLGGNVGAWSLRAVASGCTDVLAVEPMPENARQIMVNAQSARCAHKVEVLRAACVGSPDVASLKMVGGDAEYRTITWQSSHSDTRPDESVAEVPAVAINDLLTRRDRWWMLKCDVEGAEYDIFEHVDLELLSSVDYLTMEFHGKGMGQHCAWIGNDSFGALVTKLSEWGTVQTLGAASRGGQLYGWRYGIPGPRS